MSARLLVLDGDSGESEGAEEFKVPRPEPARGWLRVRLALAAVAVLAAVVCLLVALSGPSQVHGGAAAEAQDVLGAVAVHEEILEVPKSQMDAVMAEVVALKRDTEELKDELKDLARGFIVCGKNTCHGTEKCCGTLCCGADAKCCGELCCGHGAVCCMNALGTGICGAHTSECNQGLVFAEGTKEAVEQLLNSSRSLGLPAIPPAPLPLAPLAPLEPMPILAPQLLPVPEASFIPRHPPRRRRSAP